MYLYILWTMCLYHLTLNSCWVAFVDSQWKVLLEWMKVMETIGGFELRGWNDEIRILEKWPWSQCEVWLSSVQAQIRGVGVMAPAQRGRKYVCDRMEKSACLALFLDICALLHNVFCTVSRTQQFRKAFKKDQIGAWRSRDSKTTRHLQ